MLESNEIQCEIQVIFSPYRISAIIPTYNREAWLAEAIESILQQSHPVSELVVVDDGSTDGTADLVRKYPEVKYLYQQQRGPSAARNTGAKHASGNWLAFLDSDDRWLPKKLEKQVVFLTENSEFEAVYTNEIWVRNGRRVNQGKRHAKFGGWIYEQCLPLCIISPSSILLSRTLWQASGGFDESLPACEDYDLWLRIAARNPIGYLEVPLIIKNGGHEDQLSKQWGLDRYRIIALEKMLQFGALSRAMQILTIKQLVSRCKILCAGLHKHGKEEEAKFFEQKYLDWKDRIS
jgi:glycosyltransferase involved in cell wall biosynthesis